jgi:hypothetical protein
MTEHDHIHIWKSVQHPFNIPFDQLPIDQAMELIQHIADERLMPMSHADRNPIYGQSDLHG